MPQWDDLGKIIPLWIFFFFFHMATHLRKGPLWHYYDARFNEMLCHREMFFCASSLRWACSISLCHLSICVDICMLKVKYILPGRCFIIRAQVSLQSCSFSAKQGTAAVEQKHKTSVHSATQFRLEWAGLGPAADGMLRRYPGEISFLGCGGS